MITDIGFIGVGTMGLPMLTNLLKAGFRVEACDVRAAAVDAAVARGARAAASPAALAGRAQVLITMLPSSPEVETVYLGPGGVLDGARPGLVCVDMSTIDPAVTRRVGQRLAAAGLRMLDAPVSGSVPRAIEGTLTIMVGGDESTLEEVRPVLRAMGSTIIHVGPLGSGEVAKLCNNLLAGVAMIAVAEAFTLGTRAGVDPRVLFEVITKSSGNCWVLEHNCPIPGLVAKAACNSGFAPGFMVDLMAKDLSLARAAARDVGAPCFTGALAHELYVLAAAHGLGRQDFSAVIRVLSARSS